MKKIFYLALMGVFAAACQHTSTASAPAGDTTAKVDVSLPPRWPSSVKRSSYLKEVNQCGWVEYSESNYMAKDPEYNGYSMTLDCNQDRKKSRADGELAINIPTHHMGKANRDWFNSYKRQVVKTKMKARSTPYLCVKVQASSDPCRSRRNVIGFAPEFSVVTK
jgi:hypothetical protein